MPPTRLHSERGVYSAAWEFTVQATLSIQALRCIAAGAVTGGGGLQGTSGSRMRFPNPLAAYRRWRERPSSKLRGYRYIPGDAQGILVDPGEPGENPFLTMQEAGERIAEFGRYLRFVSGDIDIVQGMRLD